MKILALPLILLLAGCNGKEEPSIPVQSDLKPPESTPQTQTGSGVGTNVRKIGEIKKN